MSDRFIDLAIELERSIQSEPWVRGAQVAIFKNGEFYHVISTIIAGAESAREALGAAQMVLDRMTDGGLRTTIRNKPQCDTYTDFIDDHRYAKAYVRFLFSAQLGLKTSIDDYPNFIGFGQRIIAVA